MGYEKEAYLYQLFHYSRKKDFQESTPKNQMLMFGIPPPPSPEFKLAFHIYYVKYENTLTCKRNSWTSGGGNDVLKIFFYFQYV